jgi:hypothetical protein
MRRMLTSRGILENVEANAEGWDCGGALTLQTWIRGCAELAIPRRPVRWDRLVTPRGLFLGFTPIYDPADLDARRRRVRRLYEVWFTESVFGLFGERMRLLGPGTFHMETA